MNDLSRSPLNFTLATLAQRSLEDLADKDGMSSFDGTEKHPLTKLLDQLVAAPSRDDADLVAAMPHLALNTVDLVLLSLMIEVETSPDVSARVASLQQGEDALRPTPVLLARVASLLGDPRTPASVLGGQLFRHQILATMPSRKPLALAPLAVADSVLSVLGLPSTGALLSLNRSQSGVPESYRQSADLIARGLNQSWVCLVIRGQAVGDRRKMACALVEALKRQAMIIPEERRGDPTLGAALMLGQKVAVEEVEGPPGHRVKLARLPGYCLPRIALTSPDTRLDVEGFEVVDVDIPTLPDHERSAIWYGVLGECGGHLPPPPVPGPSTLSAIATRLVHEPSQIGGYRRAAAVEARSLMAPYGQEVSAVVDDAALVTSSRVRGELELLLARCRQRFRDRSDLGPAFHARGPDLGVRALFSGTSGGGKTLACAWLATQLDMPLFKVDLASVVSKYIGETEENLARILDRAEEADVMLLFDEADALFGARTETKDSSDRFANNQTNFLLSRIEAHSGIVLLTTNARQRIDTAFARRIDQVIEMPSPEARQRRALWLAHLGKTTEIRSSELTRLANAADISGGHIRAITNSASVLAMSEDRAIRFADVQTALKLHYRGIGRAVPSGLEPKR